MKMSQPFVFASLAVVLTTFMGCESTVPYSEKVDPNSGISSTRPTRDAPVATNFLMAKMSSCDELRNKVLDAATESILQNAWLFIDGEHAKVTLPPDEGPEKGIDVGLGSESGDSSHFTGTNNHEASADEADWVKTNGEYTFVLKGKELTILKTGVPAEMAQVKQVDLNNFTRTYKQFYRSGQRPEGPPEKRDTYEWVFSSYSDGYNSLLKGKDYPMEGSFGGETSDSDKAESIYPLELAYDAPSKTLYLFASFKVRSSRYSYPGEPSFLKSSDINGLEQGLRVIAFDVSNPEEASVRSITDLDASYGDARTVASGTYSIEKIRLLRRLGEWMTPARVADLKKLLTPIYRVEQHVEKDPEGDSAPGYVAKTPDYQVDRKPSESAGGNMEFHSKAPAAEPVATVSSDLTEAEKYEAEKKHQETRRKQARYAIYKYLSDNLTTADIEKALPMRYSYDERFASEESAPMFGCSDIYLSPVGDRLSGVAVTKLAGDLGEDPKSVGLLAPFSTVYSTGQNLYLGQHFSPYTEGWKSTKKDKESGMLEFTAIHKFSYDNKKSGLSYQATGKVPGNLLNQFSLSEYKDHLRVVTTVEDFSGFRFEEETPEDDVISQDGPALDTPATKNTSNAKPAVAMGEAEQPYTGEDEGTKPQPGEGGGGMDAVPVEPHEMLPEPPHPPIFSGPTTRLTILKQSENELVKTGEINELAPGERVYATRFVGSKGYVVTYRTVDPLFTFDLSNPEDPQVLGALKVTGYSSYIHPLDDTHLLTVGRDSDEFGRVGGFKIEVFDVSDMANPTSVKKIVEEKNSSSVAERDHRAFTFDPRLGLLSIPIESYSDDGTRFVGFKYYSVSQTKLQKVGEINHIHEFTPDCANSLVSSIEKACYARNTYPVDSYFRSIIGTVDSKPYLYTFSYFGATVQRGESSFDLLEKVGF